MAWTGEVILAVFSAVSIVAICLILLNEMADRGVKKRFKRPSLGLVKEEYMKAIRKN